MYYHIIILFDSFPTPSSDKGIIFSLSSVSIDQSSIQLTSRTLSLTAQSFQCRLTTGFQWRLVLQDLNGNQKAVFCSPLPHYRLRVIISEPVII